VGGGVVNIKGGSGLLKAQKKKFRYIYFDVTFPAAAAPVLYLSIISSCTSLGGCFLPVLDTIISA